MPYVEDMYQANQNIYFYLLFPVAPNAQAYTDRPHKANINTNIPSALFELHTQHTHTNEHNNMLFTAPLQQRKENINKMLVECEDSVRCTKRIKVPRCEFSTRAEMLYVFLV